MSTNVIRTFKIQGSGTKYTGGRYTTKNNSLASVARKAGARLYLKLSKSEIERREKNNEGIKFILRETTRGSAKNRYFFNVKRVLKKNQRCLQFLVKQSLGNTITSQLVVIKINSLPIILPRNHIVFPYIS